MKKNTFHLLEKNREILLSVLEVTKHNYNATAFVKIELENEHPDTLFKVMLNQIKDFSSIKKVLISLDSKKILNKIVEFPDAIVNDIDKYFY